MKIEWKLRRLPKPAPATMLLLVSHRIDDLLRLCARLCTTFPRFGEEAGGRGSKDLPPVYSTADGFLVRLPKPISEAVPGTIRLRNLADNLLLPVDAELVPSLLPDEAFALVKNRGLVFLPGGRLLEFDPNNPVALSDLINIRKNANRAWRSLPRPAALADRISEIGLDLLIPPADELLRSGGEDIGTEPSRPEDSSPFSRTVGGATLGLGKALVRVGDFLHIQAISRLGANWMGKALTMAPRLSEKLLGAQEAALRALLREFREGNSERALRRALPLTGHEGRGGVQAGNAWLPFRNLRYSLQKILGASSEPLAHWFGGMNVWHELDREYRRQAELATQKGDYRRAAYIYAKLLGDYRLAAKVLERGGLYSDAAAIYLQKLQDSLAAAQAFEAGREYDRALELYRRRGDHELAGDLLQRIGEQEAAFVEFEAAAQKLIETHQDYLRAGDLMVAKAHRHDLGLHYFETGWSVRPRGNPIPCALRMAKMYAGSESPERLLDLVSQAQSYLAFVEAGIAAHFYNGIAELGDQLGAHLGDQKGDDTRRAGLRDELRDRALMGIAAKMRQWSGESIAPGKIVSVLLGQTSAWSPPIVSDAAFAAKTEAKRATSFLPTNITFPSSTVKGVKNVVTATCWAPETGEIFLGFAGGQIVSYHPTTGEVTPLRVGPFLGSLTNLGNPVGGTKLYHGDPVTGLATNPNAKMVVALSQKEGDTAARIMSFANKPNGGCVLGESRSIPVADRAWLTPLVTYNSHHLAMSSGEVIQLFSGPSLVPFGHWEASTDMEDIPIAAGLLLPRLMGIGALFLGGGYAFHIVDFHEPDENPRCPVRLGWTPSVPVGSSLIAPSLAWLESSNLELELAGITEGGCLYWSQIRFDSEDKTEVITISSKCTRDEGYLAAAIIKPGYIAGVKRYRVEWLRCSAKELSKKSETKVRISSPVACYPHHATNELLLVSIDGTVGRVTMR
jgi:hypothetical protein